MGIANIPIESEADIKERAFWGNQSPSDCGCRFEGMTAMRPKTEKPLIVYGIDGEAKTIFLKD